MRPKKYLKLCVLLLISSGSCVNSLNAATKIITYDKGVKDYNVFFDKVMTSFFQSSDPELTIIVNPGKYPVLSQGHFKYYGKQKKKIMISGNQKGTLQPIFYSTGAAKPISFWFFEGNIDTPTNLEVVLDHITFLGNNVPYSANHPFFGDKAQPQTCLTLSNLLTFSVTNLRIENMYGNGIVAGNSYFKDDNKLFSIQSPIIKNVDIINSWSENHQWNSGHGIMLGYVKNASVSYCKIVNNLMYSKYYGFVGIDLEGKTEGTVIENNILEGYHTLIHDECTYGGHIISKNTFRGSLIGINISEDCNQDPKKKFLYRPITIDGNSFYYNNEYKVVSLAPSDWGFISVYKPSFTIEGLRITNNKFKVGDSKLKSSIKATPDNVASGAKLYIALRGQQKVVMQNNSYE